MTEALSTETIAPPPNKRAVRKPKRTKKRQAAPAAEKPSASNEYAGISTSSCCDGCSEKACVISGTPFCHHPLKASHPTASQAIIARVIAARTVIKHQQVDAA